MPNCAQWPNTEFSESAWWRQNTPLIDWRLVCDKGTFQSLDGTLRNKWRLYILLNDGLYNIFLATADTNSRAVTLKVEFEVMPLTFQEWNNSKEWEGWQFCDLDKEREDVITLEDIMNVWIPLLNYYLAANGAGERYWWLSAIKSLHEAGKLLVPCTGAAEEYLNFFYTSDSNPRGKDRRRLDNLDAQTRRDIVPGRFRLFLAPTIFSAAH